MISVKQYRIYSDFLRGIQIPDAVINKDTFLRIASYALNGIEKDAAFRLAHMNLPADNTVLKIFM